MNLEKDLNPAQLEAVTYGEGPLLVVAGAGSGKTRVITYRIAHLIREKGIDPAAVAAVTFTNKAAREMKERVEYLLGGGATLDTFVGTFHRFSLGLLRRHGNRVHLSRDFAIFDADDQKKLIQKALKDEGLSDSAFPPRAILSRISSAKNRLLSPGEFAEEAEGFFEEKVVALYRRYQGLLKEASAVDFDDMLRFAVKILEEDDLGSQWRGRLQHLLVDEFQDTNYAQLRMVQLLTGEGGNLTAVGDEDQGIYRWRGADLSNILRFEEIFPGAAVLKLEQNYRSTATILDAAAEVIRHNESRRPKTLWTKAEEGDLIRLYHAGDEAEESRWLSRRVLALSDFYRRAEMAVLVRTHAQTRAIEDEFVRRGIPYILVGGTRFWERLEVKDILAYLRVLRNPRDRFSLLRVINRPTRGIGRTTLALLEDRADELGMNIWDAIASDNLGRYSSRAAKALGAFRDLIQSLASDAKGLGPADLIDTLIDRTGYMKLYPGDDDENQSRRENVLELLNAARDFEERHSLGPGFSALTQFLDHVALVTDLDNAPLDRGVSILTLHAAKGLEYPVVFLPGLEDGLLPHFNAGMVEEGFEEERRLLYVGMTRAQEVLLLSHTHRRRVAGRYQDRKPSPFLLEIPARTLDESGNAKAPLSGAGRGVHRFFSQGPSSGSREPSATPRDSLEHGQRIRHPTLGYGRIIALAGNPGERDLTVLFDTFGKRKLKEKYAKLEKL